MAYNGWAGLGSARMVVGIAIAQHVYLEAFYSDGMGIN